MMKNFPFYNKLFRLELIHSSLFIIIIFVSLSSYSQSNISDTKTIHVKFKEHLKPTKSINGRTAISGVEKVDKVSRKYNTISISRIFPEAGIFEEAHIAYGLHLWYEIKITKETKLRDVIADYQGTDYFDKVEESRPYSFVNDKNVAAINSPVLLSGTNDTFFERQWNFENTGQTGGTPRADINLLKAWQIETGSPNVVVAVIDGGINLNHPDLKDALWVNVDEIPANGIDDDHNGYIDDIHGYGFGDVSATIYPDAHATHVAGTIGAVSNNGIGVSGIAGGDGINGGVKLMSCASFGKFNIGGFEAAMVYAADNGAVISQNSWGGGSTAIEAAIDYFIERAGYDNSSANFSENIQTGPMAGGVVIFSAGNSQASDPYFGYPASYDKVIAVASTDHNDKKSQFSNFGTWVDISAPGSNVFSTFSSEAEYGYLSGTSMSCPHVSGVAALVISHIQRTGLKPNEIWNRLRFSSKSISTQNLNLLGQLGWGRLDAFVALKEPDAIPPGAILDLRVDEQHSTSLLLGWTASGENYTEGQAAEYEVRYSIGPINESNFLYATRVPNSPIPPLSGEQVVFEIPNLSSNTIYYVAVKSIDLFNNISPLSNVITIRTLNMPIPELVTTQLSEQLYTGTTITKSVLIKNIGEEELLVRAGVPEAPTAPVLPPLGAKGKLFAINSLKNTIEQLDTKNGKVIHSISMPEPSSKTLEGLAYDGTFLYYGRSKRIYKINTETGNVIRTITLEEISEINGLAWSGRYLYVSGKGTTTNSIHEVDADIGAIRKRLDHYSELAYLGINNTLLRTNTNGLEEISVDNGSIIRTISLPNPKCIAYSIIDNLIFVSDSYNNLIKAINPLDGEVKYTMPYLNTTALAGDEHRYRWIETKEEVIRIPQGQIGEVPFTLISAGLNSATRNGSVNIFPMNSSENFLSMIVTMNVLASTDIETAKEVDFGTEYFGFPIDTTIIIENRGFSDLLISQIQSNNSDVKTSISSITIAPSEKVNMLVSVEPQSTGIINGNITIISNDPDEGVLTIPVRTNILEPPAISLTPDSLKATLNSGETSTLNITLTNTGASTLHWNANLVGTDSESVITNQSGFTQSGFNSPNDFAVNKNELDEITLKASSPEALTCLSYDSDGELIYARAMSSNKFYTYNLVTDEWQQIGLIPYEFYGQATYLKGKLYHGGSQLNIYTIQSGTWSSVPFPIEGTAISITSDNKHVYIAIGLVLYRFDPITKNWIELPPVPAPIYQDGFGALSHYGGIIFANGTQVFQGDGRTLFFKFFIDTNKWVEEASVVPGLASLGGAVDMSSARYFTVGAPRNSSITMQMSILDIRSGEWSNLVIPFAVGFASGLTFVGKDGASGIYFIQGSGGNKFACYNTPSAPNWFTITPSSGVLPVGETEIITMNLNSQGLFAATYQGNVRVFSNHPAIEKNAALELKVVGTPEISLSKDSLGVGDVVIGYSRGNTLVIKNKGSAELIINNVSTSSPEFTVSKTSFTLPIGESTNFSTYFNPTSIGPRAGIFTFHTNDPLNSEIQFELTGTGVYPSQIEVPLDTIYATLLTGGTTIEQLIVKNNGEGSTQYLLVGGDDSWIKVKYGGTAQNIDAHGMRTFNITINAEGYSSGTYYGSVHVEDAFMPTRPYFEVPVKMTVTSAPDIFISRDSLDFGYQLVNGEYDSIIQIKNNGVLPLSISSIECDNPAFTISIGGPLNLNPTESVNATVRFNSGLAGSYAGKITLTSNDPDEGLFIVKLNGVSINPPELSWSDEEIIVSVYEKESQSEAINLSNDGGSLLKWRIFEHSDLQPQEGDGFTSKAASISNSFIGLTEDPTSGLIYGHSFQLHKIYSYNSQANGWSEVSNTFYPQLNLKNGGSIILNSKMYCTYIEDYSKLYIFNLTLKNWTTKTNELGAGSATITTDGTLLYLAGGGKFKSYNPKTNGWIELPIPNFSLDGLGGLSYLDGVIYAHAASSNGFAKYTIATGIWESLIPLPDNAILGSTVDPVKKRYYAYGKNYLYEYDIANSVWTVLYNSVFEVGNSGGLVFSQDTENGGVYFIQGDKGKGFARYQPKSELSWLRSSQLIGEIKEMENLTIGINFNSINLTPGEYHGKINITSNDPTNLSRDIPVTFLVKRRAPTIQITTLIADTVSRLNQSIKYISIKNEGKELLDWSVASALPSWLSIDKTSGRVTSLSKDSIEVAFSPELFSSGAVADYALELNSNDPSNLKPSTRLVLTIQNHKPILLNLIANQVLNSTQLEIPLLDHFSDPDNDPLFFSVSTDVNSIAFTNLVDSKLLISPIKSGVLNISVTATDIYNSSITSTFEVNNLITGIENGTKELNFSATPNPFKNEVEIQFKGNEPGMAEIILFDITGRAVWRSHEIDILPQNKLEIDGEDLSTGIYTCILFINNKLIRSIRLLRN